MLINEPIQEEPPQNLATVSDHFLLKGNLHSAVQTSGAEVGQVSPQRQDTEIMSDWPLYPLCLELRLSPSYLGINYIRAS